MLNVVVPRRNRFAKRTGEKLRIVVCDRMVLDGSHGQG